MPALSIGHVPAASRLWPRLKACSHSSLTRIGLLALLAFLVHAPALSGPFLWDDEYLAVANPFIKSPLLIFETFRHYLFLDSYSPHYRPVQNLTLMPDYYFWSDNPFGFHLSNIFWHAAAGIALFFLLQQLLVRLASDENSAARARTGAFLIALIWAIHPVHSAAVDYISGRADSVALFFGCTAWLAFLFAERASRRLTNITLCVLAFALGLLAFCARESALILLVLFLCYQLFFDRETRPRKKLILVLSCSFLVLAYAVLHHLPGPRLHSPPSPDWPPLVRVVLMLRALGDYGRLMLFPRTLHMERTVFDPSLYKSWHEWSLATPLGLLSLFGLAVLIILIFGALRKERGRQLRIFGAIWFLVAYLPISNLVDLNATVAEHWLYVPSVGFLIFLFGCFLALPKTTYRWATVAACLFAAVLSVRSYERSADWSNAETFFTQTLASGGTSSRAAINLALIFARRGEYARSETLLRRILEFAPNDPTARNNLADTLRHLGRDQEAEKLLIATSDERETSSKDYPRTWMAVANLARLRHAQKNDAAALAILKQAETQYPDTWELISYEAEILREDKGPAAAIGLVEDFARRNWWHHAATLALGRLYAEQGRTAEAKRALLQASRLDVHDVEALNLLAQINLRENRFDDACDAQQRAIARQPDHPREYLYLSRILEKMGRTAEARAAEATVARLEVSTRAIGPLAN